MVTEALAESWDGNPNKVYFAYVSEKIPLEINADFIYIDDQSFFCIIYFYSIHLCLV
jgi:hypothetical protein